MEAVDALALVSGRVDQELLSNQLSANLLLSV